MTPFTVVSGVVPAAAAFNFDWTAVSSNDSVVLPSVIDVTSTALGDK